MQYLKGGNGCSHKKTIDLLTEKSVWHYSGTTYCTSGGSVDLTCLTFRALCRIKLLPVAHVLVDTWMLTVKPVYKLVNVSDDLKWTTNTHVTPF